MMTTLEQALPPRQTDRRLGVLFIDDSEWDVQLMVREFERAGYQVHWRCVVEACAVRHALEALCWDIVICDHRMPGLDAATVLALHRDSRQPAPLLVASGSIPLPEAVLALKAGACDFVSKQELHCLVPVVERELRLTGPHALDLHLPRGLPGRDHFLSTLALLCMPGVGGQPSAVALLRLRDFEAVRRTHGPRAARRALEELGRRMLAALPDPDYLAHYGSDAFALILPGCDTPKAAQDTLRLALQAVDAPLAMGEQPLRLHADAGLCLYPEHGTSSQALLAHAEQALRSAVRHEGPPALIVHGAS